MEGKVCARYGPVVLSWNGRRVELVDRCDKYVDLLQFVDLIELRPSDPLIVLLGIKRGSVVSYKTLGAAMGVSPRAVGALLRRNHLPVVLPCHRVVMSDRSLGGYIYGAEVKRALLQYEGVEFCGERVCGLSELQEIKDVRGALLESLGIGRWRLKNRK